ncbi:MAG: ABC transporter permease [Gemmatimonadaceae bacterium]
MINASVALVRHSWRSLRRTPAFMITASLTLVMGLGAAIAIFAVVNGVILRPLPYGDPERLVGAWHDLPPVGLLHTQQTAATYFTYRKFARSIEDIGVYQDGAVNVSEPGGAAEPQRLESVQMSRSVLELLQVPPAIGRNFSEAEDLPKGPDVLIIGHALWRNRFGADRRIIGKTLEVNGRTREIIGVMPPGFHFPSSDTQLWLPLALDPADPFGGGFNYNAIARLKPGMSLGAAQRDLAAVLPRILDVSPNMVPGVSTQMMLDQAKPQPVLVPLKQDVIGDIAGTLWMVAAAAGLVLLVACFNVANLILVRADSRQRELAVREALGASRFRVMTHLLAESALLALIAGTLGVGLAWTAVRTLVAGTANSERVSIPRLAEVHIDSSTLLFTLGLVVLVTVACSVMPALRIGRVALATTLREGGRGGTAGRAQQRIRGALVAVQIALSLMVLAGSGLLLRTFQRLHEVRLGFDPAHVATFWLSPPQLQYRSDSMLVQFFSRLGARVEALPGVQSVGFSSRLPLETYGINQNPFYAEDDESAATKIPKLQIFTTIDAGYLRTMGIPLLAGRTFEPMDRQRDGEAIISRQTAITFWNDSTGRAALGKRFRGLPSGPWSTIIGVVGDARDTALTAPPSHTVYFPEVTAADSLFGQNRRTMALVVRTSGDPEAITAAVQRVVRDLDPTLPTFDVRPMSRVVSASMAKLSFTILILGAAAVVTLFLGAVGLYGVLAYMVTLRTRELGVRLALGAQPQAIALMLARQGVALTGVGIAGGLLLFALVARFLRSFLYGVAPNDPLTLVAASLLLLFIAALASWIPARRASRVDPANTLRAE